MLALDPKSVEGSVPREEVLASAPLCSGASTLSAATGRRFRGSVDRAEAADSVWTAGE